jgi:hypothetical protein
MSTRTPPSRAAVLRACAYALLAAAAVAVLAVLARSKGAATPPSSATASTPINADAAGGVPPLDVWSMAHAEKYHTGVFEVTLRGAEELEYKATLSRGEPLLYSWKVKQGGRVYFEFHGAPTEGKWPDGYYESYEKGEGSNGHGSMVAPFTGVHGWYWLNLSDQPITIEVELAGYFSDFKRQGQAH